MPEYIPGLAGIPAAESAISFINGQEGILEYRGIRIEELCEQASFEEVTFLLLRGHLPSQSELDAFNAQINDACTLEPGLLEMIRCFPKDAHPMVALQTMVAAKGMWMERGQLKDPAARERMAIEFIAKFPSLVAAAHRARIGKDFVAASPELSRAADFLRMLSGETPDELSERVMNVSLILHADHTMNASTFATRVVASTESEPAAALAAAVGSLSGPLHGGANERVLMMLDEIGSEDKVEAWFTDKLERKEKVMGLGHRVYKTKDPRAHVLQGLVTELFETKGHSDLYAIAQKLEELAAEKLGSRGIYPNVDYYSGIVYNKLGIPTDLFTPIFAVSRVSGWMAHWLEQMAGNRLFRPGQKYVGEREKQYVPMDQR